MLEKTKSIIVFISGLALLTGLVIGVLGMLGVVNIGVLFGGKGTFIPINYEKELKEMCNNIDSDGYYNKEEYLKVSSKFEEFYKDENKKDIYDLTDDFWEVYMGSKYCVNKICTMNPPYKDRVSYEYNCKKDIFKEIKLDDRINENIAEGILNNACSMLNKNGIYEGGNPPVKCGNYKCELTYYGNTYTKDCEKNGF